MSTLPSHPTALRRWPHTLLTALHAERGGRLMRLSIEEAAPLGRMRGWTPARGTQICPACLAETGAWQTVWRLLTVTACTRHETLLVAECPACRRPFPATGASMARSTAQ